MGVCFVLFVFVFFFQAEDGIRDIGVTGVQTCALPISRCQFCISNAALVLSFLNVLRYSSNFSLIVSFHLSGFCEFFRIFPLFLNCIFPL